MTEAERKELEELRRYKAEKEGAEQTEKADIPPLEQRILDDYNIHGVPIVDIARRHDVSVERVLVITGNSDLLSVSVIGDQVDPSEIGNQGTYNPGQSYEVRYTKN